MSTAVNFEKRFNECSNIDKFKERVLGKCASHGAWGPDGDTMYWFDDGSMLLERRIVREFQLFKG